MTTRRLMTVALAAGCAGSNDCGQGQAAASTTTTTTPDPATTACREHNADATHRPKEGDAALNQLTLSRDARIVAAAREVDRIITDSAVDPDAVPPNLDLEYASATWSTPQRSWSTPQRSWSWRGPARRPATSHERVPIGAVSFHTCG